MTWKTWSTCVDRRSRRAGHWRSSVWRRPCVLEAPGVVAACCGQRWVLVVEVEQVSRLSHSDWLAVVVARRPRCSSCDRARCQRLNRRRPSADCHAPVVYHQLSGDFTISTKMAKGGIKTNCSATERHLPYSITPYLVTCYVPQVNALRPF